MIFGVKMDDDNKLGIEIIGLSKEEFDLLPYGVLEPTLRPSIRVTLIKDPRQRERVKWMVLQHANGIPFGVEMACQCLSELFVRPFSPVNEFNSFYQDGCDLWGFFSYPTDDFCVHLHDSMIEVYGQVHNLSRVIKDIMMVSSTILPLHAAAMCMDNKGFCIVGDSQMGKSYLASFLLEQGCRFIADDASFVSGNSLINVDRELWVRKDMLCVDSPFDAPAEKTVLYVKPQFVCKDSAVELHSIFTLTRESRSAFGIHDLRQPFPVIPRQSFWCSSLIDTPNLQIYLSTQISRSITYWDGFLRHSINIVSHGNLKDVFNRIAFQIES